MGSGEVGEDCLAAHVNAFLHDRRVIRSLQGAATWDWVSLAKVVSTNKESEDAVVASTTELPPTSLAQDNSSKLPRLASSPEIAIHMPKPLPTIELTGCSTKALRPEFRLLSCYLCAVAWCSGKNRTQ
jgi:hypothetical protein